MIIELFYADGISKIKTLDSKNNIHERSYIKTTLYDSPCISFLADKKRSRFPMINYVGIEESLAGRKTFIPFGIHQNLDNPNSEFPRSSQQPLQSKAQEKIVKRGL